MILCFEIKTFVWWRQSFCFGFYHPHNTTWMDIVILEIVLLVVRPHLFFRILYCYQVLTEGCTIDTNVVYVWKQHEFYHCVHCSEFYFQVTWYVQIV
jgi:hypothetical protein